ncbi:preddicted heavy metal transport/detoxification protein [Alteracholeplasma palmae J233]|uniref:Preddicted heavy metal transport/detoxification protein n=1 Tax=Alteracholeplasma palmae (strain ATCC 49389 / J233) TaxID=1318466 RepID=U4KKX4_ALTPJ|nr:heavy-metal-associated domain-containing protein [Alteracholeplasma palmae]CCV64464.1 preddicted heavy metal transport/detoxification protein [Alteracholeplasma palmae J233]
MKVITVTDMSCQHCVAKINKALLTKGVVGKIDLAGHTVSVKEADEEKALVAIEEAGYTPTL